MFINTAASILLEHIILHQIPHFSPDSKFPSYGSCILCYSIMYMFNFGHFKSWDLRKSVGSWSEPVQEQVGEYNSMPQAVTVHLINLSWLFNFQLESSCVSIHEILKVVADSQTWYRLREAHDRTKAEHLLERVTYWSVGETVLLFVIGIGQVMLLRSFFTEKKGSVAATT